MADKYYKPCAELDKCNELIEKYYKTKQYELCFKGHLELAEKGYPLAECQVGYFYLEDLGVEKNIEQAVLWTKRAANHGDWDAQYNLAWFYENGIGVKKDSKKAALWYEKSASQGQKEAIKKCKELHIEI